MSACHLAPAAVSTSSSRVRHHDLPWRLESCPWGQRPQLPLMPVGLESHGDGFSPLPPSCFQDEARRQGLSCGFHGAPPRPSTLQGSPPAPLDPFLIRGRFHPWAWLCAPHPPAPGASPRQSKGQSKAGDPTARHGPSPAFPRSQDQESGREFWDVSPKQRGSAAVRSLPSRPEAQRGRLPVVRRTARPGLSQDPRFPLSRRLVRGTGPEKETFRITERSGWSLSKAPFRPQPLPSQGGSLRSCPENPFHAGAGGTPALI